MRNMNSVTGEYGTVLSDRALTILKKHKGDDKSLASVKMFLYDMLEPTAERGDMLYRYEHSLRVAENGALLAEREGLPREELVTACLLHDVGYRECHKDEDFRRHQFISADIAGIYLKNIGYEEEILQETESQIVELVILMTRKVIKILSENQKNVVMANTLAALKKLKARGQVTLRVNLEDVKLTTAHVDEFIQHVEKVEGITVLEDSSVDQGGCIVETDFGAIDARISSQLNELENKILEISPVKNIKRDDPLVNAE